MARPLKQGLDYYPMDVGFLRDIKVRRIIKSCGASSIAVLIWLLNSCYQDEGYYLRWTKDLPFIVAEDTDVTEGHVQEVVKKALQVGFFDESMKDNYEILTSVGIQKRFLAVTSRRKSVFLRRDFALISINDDNNSVNVCNNSVNVYKSTQSKVKESKVKESKKRDRTTTTKFTNIDEWEELITSYAGKNESLSGSLRTWVSMRKDLAKKRKEVFTTQALRMGLKKLQTLSNGNETVAVDIVNQSVEFSWKSFYPIKDSRRPEEKKKFILPDYYGMQGGSNGNSR